MIIKKIGLYGLLCSVIGTLLLLGIDASNHHVSMDFLRNWTAVSGSGGVYGSLPLIKIDNQVAWCLQANKALETGTNTTINFTDIGISEEQEKVISLIANFGYYSQPSEDNYALVQNLVWEYLGYTDHYVSSNYPSRQSQQSWKDQVLAKVNAYQTGLSFHNTTSSINVGETLTFTDNNGLLSGMQIVSTDGLQASINGNTLTVIGTVNAKDTARIKIMNPVSNEGINFVVRNGQSQSISILNTKEPNYNWITLKVNKYVDVNLEKVDCDLDAFIPQGEATLIGAEYGLFNSKDELINTKVFDETGKVRFEKLWANDTYYIKETKAPIGYVLSDEIIPINPAQLLSSGNVGADLQWNIRVKETVKKQAFSIIKISSNGESTEVTTLKDAEFTVKLKQEVESVGWEQATNYQTLITDEKGYALSKELPYGSYIVKETKTPANMQTTKDFLVEITQDSREPQAYRILNDAPFEAYLKLVKQDLETGEIIVFNQASFQIKDSEGKIISQKVGSMYIDTFTTDAQGVVTTPLKLKAGVYYLHEIQTPLGYITLEDPLVLTIEEQGAVQVDPDGDPILTVVVNNEKPVGIIKIQKSFEEIEETLNLFAKFKVLVNCDIINPATGEVIYHKGDVFANPKSTDGLYSTDENLTIEITNLPMSTGKAEYKVIEVETNNQYELSKEIIVSFEQTDTLVKEYIYDLEVENSLTTTKIIKEDATTKELLSDANLQIIDVKGTLIDEWITTDAAYEVKGLQRNQEYTLHEQQAPRGYLIANDIVFGVGENSVIMKDAPILTDIEITKIDAKSNAILKKYDFSFTLYANKECTKEITTMNANTKMGTVTFIDIPYGTVYIKEASAPLGYQLSKEVISIEIDENLEGIGEVHKIEYKNTPLPSIQTGDTSNNLWYGILNSLALIIMIGTFLQGKVWKLGEE